MIERMTTSDKLDALLQMEPMLEDNISKLITAAYTLVDNGDRNQYLVECETFKMQEYVKKIGEIFLSYRKGGLD